MISWPVVSELARGYYFGDHLSYVGTDEVCAQPFAIFGIEDHFYKAIGSTGSLGFTRCAEGELANLDLVTCFLGTFFGIAYRCDLRRAICTQVRPTAIVLS